MPRRKRSRRPQVTLRLRNRQTGYIYGALVLNEHTH